MEASIILNIVLLSLVLLGFITYQIWIGFSLVKLFKKNSELKRIIRDVELSGSEKLKKSEESLRKSIDRLDSRLDTKVDEIYSNFENKIK
jgi:hypothetical protein